MPAVLLKYLPDPPRSKGWEEQNIPLKWSPSLTSFQFSVVWVPTFFIFFSCIFKDIMIYGDNEAWKLPYVPKTGRQTFFTYVTLPMSLCSFKTHYFRDFWCLCVMQSWIKRYGFFYHVFHWINKNKFKDKKWISQRCPKSKISVLSSWNLKSSSTSDILLVYLECAKIQT